MFRIIARFPVQPEKKDEFLAIAGELAAAQEVHGHFRGGGALVAELVGPLLHAECLHITPIKEQAARVVMPMADEIAAESALAHAAVGLDEVFLSFLQCQRLLPNFRMEVGNLCKYVREKTV